MVYFWAEARKFIITTPWNAFTQRNIWKIKHEMQLQKKSHKIQRDSKHLDSSENEHCLTREMTLSTPLEISKLIVIELKKIEGLKANLTSLRNESEW